MALKKYKPTTPSTRGLVLVDRSELYKGKPVKKLTEGQNATGGRNNLGRITLRFRGGGHKQAYRIIDFKRRKFDMPATVDRIEYDPNRTAYIALITYADGEQSYILAPQKLKVGDTVLAAEKTDVQIGNAMKLRYVVIISVDRDDLRDGGAQHFADCIREIRTHSPHTKIETLVPDFRGRLEVALEKLAACPPDVLNHNLETVPRLYKQCRPGADYANSLKLLKDFKAQFPHIPTKSGLMLGLGETDEEILQVLRDLREHNVEMLTIGQYLQPSIGHLPVMRYVTPENFKAFEQAALEMGFSHAACGPMVRSSYHADQQAHESGLL